MARIIPKYRKDADGNVETVPYAYSIRVYRGRNAEGKQLPPYQKTWHVPEGLKNEKKIQQALAKAVGEFETDCGRGLVSNDRRTISVLIREYTKAMQCANKRTTRIYYKKMLPLIDEKIGHIKVIAITPAQLGDFYYDLQWTDCRRDKKARAKEILFEIIKEQKYTQTELERLTGLSENTIRNMRRGRNVSVETAECVSKKLEYQVDELFDIFSVRNADEGPGLSSKTILEYHNFLHAAFDYAVRNRIIPNNPADYVMPPKHRRKEAKWLEIDEVKKIMESMEGEPIKYRVMVQILIETGIRRGELIGLSWPRIDFERCLVQVQDNLQRDEDGEVYIDSTKGNNKRWIAVSQYLIDLLIEYKKEQDYMKEMLSCRNYEYNPGNFLFIQESGEPMHASSLAHWMDSLEKRKGIPHIYPHLFRHTQASILAAANVDPVTISKRLGHAQVSTTQNIYSHMLEKMDSTASAAIAGAIYE